MAKQKKFVQNNNNLAIAYCRYSSHAQNEASIDQQREHADTIEFDSFAVSSTLRQY